MSCGHHTYLSVFKVEVLDEVGVDSADLRHEVERLVEVLLPQALVLDKLQEVGALDESLQPSITYGVMTSVEELDVFCVAQKLLSN